MTCFRTIDDIDGRGQADPGQGRFQRAHAGRQGDGRDAHRACGRHAEGAGGQGRAGRRAVAFRQTEGKGRALDVPAADCRRADGCARRHARRLRRRLYRRARAQGGRRLERWRSSRCSRTSAFTRARRTTIRTSPTELASLGELYVNDAFSCSHRAHASIDGVAERLPAYAGRLMQAELEALERRSAARPGPAAARRRRRQGFDQARGAGPPARPGRRADHRRRDGRHLPACRGAPRSASRCASRTSPRPRARSIVAKAAERSRRRAAGRCRRGTPARARRAYRAPSTIEGVGDRGDDSRLGPTVGRDRQASQGCKTLLWNGPLGAFEIAALRQGHGRGCPGGGEAHQSRQADQRRRRRRYGGSAAACRRARGLLLRLDGGRSFPGMARGQGAARASPRCAPAERRRGRRPRPRRGAVRARGCGRAGPAVRHVSDSMSPRSRGRPSYTR